MSLYYPVKLYEEELSHICAVLSNDPSPRAKPIYEKLKRKLERLKVASAERIKHDSTNRKQSNARSRQGCP